MTMTPQVSKQEAEALARYVHTLRPAWDVPGVISALGKTVVTRPWLPLDRLAAVATRVAKNPKMRTPAVIPMEGTHWRDDINPAPFTAVEPCPRHPDARTRRGDGECGGCFADRAAAPPRVAPRVPAERVDLRALVRAQVVPTPDETAGQDHDGGYEIRGSVA